MSGNSALFASGQGDPDQRQDTRNSEQQRAVHSRGPFMLMFLQLAVKLIRPARFSSRFPRNRQPGLQPFRADAAVAILVPPTAHGLNTSNYVLSNPVCPVFQIKAPVDAEFS
jgi:hypothetical protein